MYSATVLYFIVSSILKMPFPFSKKKIGLGIYVICLPEWQNVARKSGKTSSESANFSAAKILVNFFSLHLKYDS